MKHAIKPNKEIAALYNINNFLSQIENLDSLLQMIMQEASKTVQAEASSIALYDPQQKDLYFSVSLGKKGAQVKEIRLKLGQGIIGFAAQNRKPLNIPDVSKDPRFHAGVDKKTQFKTKSILAVPIIRQKKLIGALEVINKKGGRCFTPQDVKLLEIVSGQAAIAIENAKLYQRLIQKHEALKEKHRQIIASQKKMLLMERMSAIGDMAGRMVHDLRNPLMVIRGYGELLKDPTTVGAEKEEYSKIIMDEVDRLTGMTTELMDFVKGKTSVLFKDYPLADFINELGNYLKRDFQAREINLIVESNFAGNVCMDKYKMQRAIFNVTFNAKDIIPKGGSFKIETKQAGDQVEISLSDTGPGIPPEIIDKLGQPFATFGKAHGTGLGLAIVKKIVELHKGALIITSPPPQPGAFNTTFTIRIPIKAAAQASA